MCISVIKSKITICKSILHLFIYFLFWADEWFYIWKKMFLDIPQTHRFRP